MRDDDLRADLLFSALADPVRRDIVERVYDSELTVNQIAVEYDMSLAAVSKHIRILREADLVVKRRRGRYQLVSTNKVMLAEAAAYFDRFERLHEPLVTNGYERMDE